MDSWVRMLFLIACIVPAFVECKVRHYKFNVSKPLILFWPRGDIYALFHAFRVQDNIQYVFKMYMQFMIYSAFPIKICIVLLNLIQSLYQVLYLTWSICDVRAVRSGY